MAEAPIKMERDYSGDVDAQLPQAQALAKAGKLQQALDQLLVLEKQTRTGGDMLSNGRVLVGIVQMCFEAADWKQLQEQLTTLSKKHGLLKMAVKKMVEEAANYIEKTPNMQLKLEFIGTLRTITEGKIYVEVERARVTRTLAKIKEDEGKINEAADVLQELQVETFGSMEKREKTDFILEQMRLNLARKDYVRAQIISKKINTKYFEKVEVQDLKLRYYELMIQHALHDAQYLNVCKNYREVYNTPSVKEDEAKWSEILRYIVMFIALSPYNNEQSDLIHRISQDKNFEKLPLYKQLLKSFTTNELMRWPKIDQLYKAELQKSFVFDPKVPGGQEHWKDLHDRVIEHNIRVISQYYERITVKRLTELLDLTAAETEAFLSKLVSNKTIYARIDRVDGIISFRRRQDPSEVVDEWSTNIHTMLDLIAQTKHLITKEEMVSKITQVTS